MSYRTFIEPRRNEEHEEKSEVGTLIAECEIQNPKLSFSLRGLRDLRGEYLFLKRYIASVFLVALFAFVSIAQQPQRRTAEEYIKVLETERRIEGLQITKVIETLKIKPGQRVGDLGAGSGLFSRPIAKKLGDKGLVYAIDIDPGLLKHVEKTAAAEKITNIKTVLAAEDAAKIPEKVDLIIIIDTLHHIGNQGPYLKGLKKYLKRGGRIAIIDFSNEWPAGHESMKYSLEQLEGWMKDAGFKRTEKHDFLNNNFFVIYK